MADAMDIDTGAPEGYDDIGMTDAYGDNNNPAGDDSQQQYTTTDEDGNIIDLDSMPVTQEDAWAVISAYIEIIGDSLANSSLKSTDCNISKKLSLLMH